uniref:Uncharacterized protein n=1 Tax=Catharus ustulatus TaxID=91951 RepID=A0A8C3V0T8_CATUS
MLRAQGWAHPHALPGASSPHPLPLITALKRRLRSFSPTYDPTPPWAESRPGGRMRRRDSAGGAGGGGPEAPPARGTRPSRLSPPRPGRARRPQSGPSPPPAPTLDHVAVDGGAELLAGRAVPVLPVDDPHLLEEGGLAALARAQQQDLDEALHVAAPESCPNAP